MKDDNDILKMFILGYIIAGHTVTDDSINWIRKQIGDFMSEWKHGLELGFLPPLMVCLYKIKQLEDPEDCSSCFTLTYNKHWYKTMVETYIDKFKLPPF